MKCDELKAVHAFDVYEAYTKTGDDDAAQVYLKSEADKVIAELKEKADHDCAHWKMQFENSKTSLRETEEACLQYNLERNHSNYKRCLAMADKCVDLCHKAKDLYRWAEDENLEHHYSHKIEFFARWHKRWLDIAEKFKEAK